jgi:hypothetical protein
MKKITDWLLGAAKAVVAGIAIGGAGLAIVLGADKEIVGAVAIVLGPLLVYITKNKESV